MSAGKPGPKPLARSEHLERIARVHLQVETLATRNSDRLDFHDLSVTSLEAALIAAYEAGRKAGQAALVGWKVQPLTRRRKPTTIKAILGAQP